MHVCLHPPQVSRDTGVYDVNFDITSPPIPTNIFTQRKQKRREGLLKKLKNKNPKRCVMRITQNVLKVENWKKKGKASDPFHFDTDPVPT